MTAKILKSRMKADKADAILNEIMSEKNEELIYPKMLIYGNINCLQDNVKDMLEILSRKFNSIYFGIEYSKDIEYLKNLTIVYYITLDGDFVCKKNTHIKKKESLDQKFPINSLKWSNYSYTTTTPSSFTYYYNIPSIDSNLNKVKVSYARRSAFIDTEAKINWDDLLSLNDSKAIK